MGDMPNVVAVGKRRIHHNAVKAAQSVALQKIALKYVSAETSCGVFCVADGLGKHFAKTMIQLDCVDLRRGLGVGDGLANNTRPGTRL